MRWLGTLASVAGSFMVALGFAIGGYSLFILGSVSWLYVGIRGKDGALITMNGIFLVANLIGFVRSC